MRKSLLWVLVCLLALSQVSLAALSKHIANYQIKGGGNFNLAQ